MGIMIGDEATFYPSLYLSVVVSLLSYTPKMHLRGKEHKKKSESAPTESLESNERKVNTYALHTGGIRSSHWREGLRARTAQRKAGSETASGTDADTVLSQQSQRQGRPFFRNE